MRSLQLSLPQLQQNFKKVEFAATLECSGNRRAEMKAIPAPCGSGHTIKGLDWDAGAIGTAVWGGVKLRDVLTAAGVAVHRRVFVGHTYVELRTQEISRQPRCTYQHCGQCALQANRVFHVRLTPEVPDKLEHAFGHDLHVQFSVLVCVH